MSTVQATPMPPSSPTADYATPGDRGRVGIPSRLIADVIDGVIGGILCGVISFVLTLILGIALGNIGIAIARIVGLCVLLAYYGLEVLKAQSVGKMILKLMITK